MELKDFEEALFDGSSAGETELTAKQSAESLRAVCSVRVVDEIDVCVLLFQNTAGVPLFD